MFCFNYRSLKTPGIDEMIMQSNRCSHEGSLTDGKDNSPNSSASSSSSKISQTVIDTLRSKLQSRNLAYPFTDLELRRWLIQRRTIPKALLAIERHLAWRKENDVDHILEEPVTDEELRVQLEADVFEFLPESETDPKGRPIVLCFPAKHAEHCGVGKVDIKKFVIYYQEYLTKLLNRMNSQDFVAILDLKGCKIKHFDYSIAKSVGELNRQHYPERLGKVYVINYPMFYHVVWFVVKNWLARKTQAKIKFKDAKKVDISYIMENKKMPENFAWK